MNDATPLHDELLLEIFRGQLDRLTVGDLGWT